MGKHIVANDGDAIVNSFIFEILSTLNVIWDKFAIESDVLGSKEVPQLNPQVSIGTQHASRPTFIKQVKINSGVGENMVPPFGSAMAQHKKMS